MVHDIMYRHMGIGYPMYIKYDHSSIHYRNGLVLHRNIIGNDHSNE
jgi:hypothetical protein